MMEYKTNGLHLVSHRLRIGKGQLGMMLRSCLLSLCFSLLLSTNALSQGWSPMPIQIDPPGAGKVYALYSSDDLLYVGGAFTSIDGLTVNSLAIWNSSAWSNMDQGVNVLGGVYDMVNYSAKLYVGGRFFLNLDSGQTKHIARWNGVTWDSVGSGVLSLTQEVNALAVYQGELYAGGRFNEIGGISVNKIARWNDTTWADVGGGMPGGTFSVQCMEVYKGELYAGGGFSQAGSVNANSIARWDGTQWNNVGGVAGAGGFVGSMTVDTINNLLYAAVGGVGMKQWDGSTWTQISGGTTGDTIPGGYALGMYKGELYSGGGGPGITAAGDSVYSIARWDGNVWKAVGEGTNNTIMSFGVYRDTLYVGGLFTMAGGDSAIHLARWFLDTTLGIEGWVPERYSLSLYPNPAKESFTVETNVQHKKAQLKVYSIKGELVKSQPLPLGKSKLQLSTNKWARGIYICKIEVKGKALQSKKIVIE